MNNSEIKVSAALSQHFGKKIEVKEEKDKDGFPIFRVNEKLSYFVSNEFSINGIPLGKNRVIGEERPLKERTEKGNLVYPPEYEYFIS